MRSRPFVMVLVMLAVLAGGCAKKHSSTTPTPTSEPPPRPATVPAAPPVAATTTAATAAVHDPLTDDLATVNRYLREQGLLADVLFDYDHHDLRADARRQLEANARFLNEHQQFQIALEGHADERGTIEYNLALGQKRAATARSFLDVMGVSRDRLQATSYGEERPLCTERIESCWQRNRRVHFEIVGRVE
jgi:peptidoglycan-associated lipoprotein